MIKLFYNFKNNRRSNKKVKRYKKFLFKKILRKLKKIFPTVIQLISRYYDNNVLAINTLDFENFFFCDGYIANRHLSGKENDNEFFTKYATPVYDSSFSSLSIHLLRNRCAKKDIMLFIYKPKQLQFYFTSQKLCTITSRQYEKNSKFFIFKVIKFSDKLTNYLFFINKKLNSLSYNIDKNNYFYQASPVGLNIIQDGFKAYPIKINFLDRSMRIAQQMVSFLSFTEYKYFISEEESLQKYSNNQSAIKDDNLSKTKKNNFYKVFRNNNEYCLMSNISMNTNSKLSLSKVNPLKRKLENDEIYLCKRPKIENGRFNCIVMGHDYNVEKYY